ncbi:MAG TPA: gluconate 2-dehydrogenase subunit 3 family protein [Vicinamibacteria bacterium]|nr:gluconate 2-dehydrogenase subunit 3 family protein [Vicinamibacteria bacterium]
MDDPYAVGRRGFLKTSAVAAAATAAACAGPRSRWRSLSEDEAATLAAACDQIVPPDEDPGAAQAGVVTFVDRQLATRRKAERSRWQAGLRGLDATARRRHGQPFAALAFETQTSVIQDVEKGAVEAADWTGVEPRAFFALLREYTMMGFYGDPRHGGNKDRVSWKMLGVPDPPIRGRLHETPPAPALAPRPAAPPSPARKG